jgi:hypothetical protein
MFLRGWLGQMVSKDPPWGMEMKKEQKKKKKKTHACPARLGRALGPFGNACKDERFSVPRKEPRWSRARGIERLEEHLLFHFVGTHVAEKGKKKKLFLFLCFSPDFFR